MSDQLARGAFCPPPKPQLRKKVMNFQSVPVQEPLVHDHHGIYRGSLYPALARGLQWALFFPTRTGAAPAWREEDFFTQYGPDARAILED